MGHIYKNALLFFGNKLMERSKMISSLILRGLVNISFHPMSIQSSYLIMALAHHYTSKDKVVRSIIGEMVLYIHPNNIEKVFHLPPTN